MVTANPLIAIVVNVDTDTGMGGLCSSKSFLFKNKAALSPPALDQKSSSLTPVSKAEEARKEKFT